MKELFVLIPILLILLLHFTFFWYGVVLILLYHLKITALLHCFSCMFLDRALLVHVWGMSLFKFTGMTIACKKYLAT